MTEITNSKGETIIYGDSPHLIQETADSYIFATTSPVAEKNVEEYVSEEIVDGGLLIDQRADK